MGDTGSWSLGWDLYRSARLICVGVGVGREVAWWRSEIFGIVPVLLTDWGIYHPKSEINKIIILAVKCVNKLIHHTYNTEQNRSFL